MSFYASGARQRGTTFAQAEPVPLCYVWTLTFSLILNITVFVSGCVHTRIHSILRMYLYLYLYLLVYRLEGNYTAEDADAMKEDNSDDLLFQLNRGQLYDPTNMGWVQLESKDKLLMVEAYKSSNNTILKGVSPEIEQMWTIRCSHY